MYKQCLEQNTIKKYQQYFKTWKELATAHQHLRQGGDEYFTFHSRLIGIINCRDIILSGIIKESI